MLAFGFYCVPVQGIFTQLLLRRTLVLSILYSAFVKRETSDMKNFSLFTFHVSLLSSKHFKHFPHYFFIIEMILHPFYFLVFFMTLSSDQHYIFSICQTDRRFYCLSPVYYRDIFSFCCSTYSCLHIFYNLSRVFASWIITCEYHFIAMLTSYFSHYRSFCFISI